MLLSGDVHSCEYSHSTLPGAVEAFYCSSTVHRAAPAEELQVACFSDEYLDG